jgi:hypothetical protein
MPRCPNCSRETLRTEDWACQWCGYPLSSSSYKKIPKTYKQLKEERLHKPEPIQKREPEPGAKPVLESQAEPIPEAKKEAEKIPEAIPILLPKPELEREAGPIQEIKPEPEPELKAEPEAEPVLESKIEPVSESEKEAELMQERKPEPEPELKAEPEAEPVLESKIEPVSESEKEAELMQERKPEPEPESKAEPETKPELESEVETIPESEKEAELEPAAMELTVEELLSAYETDEVVADAKFVNKILRVTGVVAMIDIKNKLETHYIRLTGAEEDLLQSVQCVFNKKHAPALEQLEKGQTVTVQGTYNGSIIAIRMVDCVLVP